MSYSHLLLHYGELSTKGLNKRLFIQTLARNVKWALRDERGLSFSFDHNHGYIAINEENDIGLLLERLRKVPGLTRITPIRRCSLSFPDIARIAVEEAALNEGKTFKVEVKRANHHYEMDSYELARSLGGEILKGNPALKVDVHNPDFRINVEVREKEAYVSSRTYKGAGGYPLGANGKVMHLLSGGIDSPVAAEALLRRGLMIECLHFAAPPYTSEAVIDKLVDLLGALSSYQESYRLHIVPFTKLQLAIYENVPEPYCITIMRRMMLRIGERYAKKRRCLAISTGESVGQVASQTLQSLVAINDVTSFPIIRPLAVLDKLDVIEKSKAIGTYDISIRPYEDCCTIFKPKKPKTNPTIEESATFESRFDWEALLEETVHNIRTIIVKDGMIEEEAQ